MFVWVVPVCPVSGKEGPVPKEGTLLREVSHSARGPRGATRAARDSTVKVELPRGGRAVPRGDRWRPGETRQCAGK